MLASCLLLFSLGAAADLESLVHSRLEGGPPIAAAYQRMLSDTLGWSVTSPRGVTVAGPRASVRDLDRTVLAEEIGVNTPLLHYVQIGGHGPEPLQVQAVVPVQAGTIEVFRRLEKGLFARMESPIQRTRDRVAFEVDFPGEFVVREEDQHSHVDWEALAQTRDGKGAIYQKPPPSRDPVRKEVWRFYRVAPEQITGRYPLVLVHGLGTDRWAEFIAWATGSPEAEAFRARYQLWNFSHPMGGINAALGYDPQCPTFDESIVAYQYRMMKAAETEGVETDGIRYFFPQEPLALMGNSQGVQKIRAFLIHFPEYGERSLAHISLGGSHHGSPWATAEWIRHTASRLGLLTPSLVERLVDFGFSTNYFSVTSQNDIDTGWLNHDAAGGAGLPTRAFTTWSSGGGRRQRMLSPRDANQLDARTLPGYEGDTTFEPQVPLENLCGALDQITPAARGELYADRIFLYASYTRRGRDWWPLLTQAIAGEQAPALSAFENAGLRVAYHLFGLVASEGGDWPLGVYRFNDGFVPLQSQLMLDGKETERVYETRTVLGWTVPLLPLRPNWDVIHAHTLGDPAKIRIFPGWSHLDTVTGRYNRFTGESELFRRVAEDLLSVLPPA
jgi:hypothetical protein